ncbi:MAG: tRNA-intron lyase [Methanocellales archaeon]|nr:tRNA-intron lyase [Methanocellales archaeon]MDD3291192.1 tRNA-intron lyase [Methanocellales archaeon]MDD5235292.1 tRNA-intron lyase [Methanocellales archaeon]MDD5484552.1 tRNA-intron lyase [Methanocellales archaeon]
MNGELIGDKVIVGSEALTELYDSSYYGRPREDTLELSLTEASYLLERAKITIALDKHVLSFAEFFKIASMRMENFELKYLVYKDLKERGYHVQPSATDFRLYPRGKRPGETPAEYFVHVISERKPLPLAKLTFLMETAENVRKGILLAIVDEESEVTFYEVKRAMMKGDMKPVDHVKEEALLLEDRAMIFDSKLAHFLYHNGFFGKLQEERLQLSLVESAYLLKKKVIEIVDRSGHALSLRKFTGVATKIEPTFKRKLNIYEDMRNKGMVVKTGFKFGSHFRVYKKIEPMKRLQHSEYLVHAIPEDHIFLLPEMSRAIRLAQSVRKQMIFAYIKDKKVKYIDIGRAKP